MSVPSEAPAKDQGGADALSRRARNYWEPTFESVSAGDFASGEWNFDNNRGPHRCIFDLRKCNLQVISNVQFSNCDFHGEAPTYLKFVECSFELCHFGGSIFVGAKFSDCSFVKTAFSVSTFKECEFRRCHFKEIGFSGNTTKLTATLITNPAEFISAGYTRINPDGSGDKTTNPLHQQAQLDQTKSILARILLENCSASGDDDTYYSAVRIAYLQHLTAKRSTAKWDRSQLDLNWKNSWEKASLSVDIILHDVERFLLILVGCVNGWGANLFRPLLLGIAIILLFSLVYYHYSIYDNIWKCFIASVDITFLIGYTKHANVGLGKFKEILFLLNGIVGIFWYSITIPTFVSRVSRVR